MKNILHLLILLACVVTIAPGRSSARDCAAYAVADAVTGHLFDSSGANRKLQIGSITKIATAMVVLDWAEVANKDLNALVTVPYGMMRLRGRSNPIGFQPGDEVSMRDLLYAALLQSDNIAAYTLAVRVGHTLPHRGDATPEEIFVAQMNALARKLKMKHTVFLNSHGLDDREHPYSTASDLVLLTKYAVSRSAFRFYVSQRERRITRNSRDGGVFQYDLANTNELLGVKAVDGVKTGRTPRAGECAVISAARQPEAVRNPNGSVSVTPRRLIIVVLGAKVNQRFAIASNLIDKGWDLYDQWAAAGRPLKEK